MEYEKATQLVLLFKDQKGVSKYYDAIEESSRNTKRKCFHCPLIDCISLQSGVEQLRLMMNQLKCAKMESFDYWGVVLTSPRAAKIVTDIILELGIDPLHLEELVWLVVGDATASELANVVPDSKIFGRKNAGSDTLLLPHISKLFANVIAKHPIKIPRLLFVAGNIRRNTIPDFLTSNGIPFDEMTVYETVSVSHPQIPDLFKGKRTGDNVSRYAVFFSPSGVKSLESCDTLGEDVDLIAIGKTTAESLRTSPLKRERRILTCPSPSPAGVLSVLD